MNETGNDNQMIDGTQTEEAMSNPSPTGVIRVLVIDDDRKLCRLIQDFLEPFGYSVGAVHTGTAGLERAASGEYEVVILDVMLPEMDGFEVLKQLRRESEIPVLMLTSRGDETDRIVGLEMGADDYLPKTFSSRELLARLRAVIRRSSASAPKAKEPVQQPIVSGPLRIQPASRTVFLNDIPLDLTPVEFDLLWHLAQGAGRVLSRDQLLQRFSDREYEVFDRAIDVHVSSLRRKLGDDPRNPRFIKTVRSAGYMFLDEVSGS